MKFKLMIDDTGYKEKPDPYIGIITNRILFAVSEHTKELTLNELADELEQGKTLIPAVMSGNKTSGEPYDTEKHFSESQLFLIDIDNDKRIDGRKYVSENPADELKIKEICNKYGIEPALIYESFTSRTTDPNGKVFQKYHILFAVDEPVKDLKTAKEIIGGLQIMFKGYADKSASNIGRLLFGTVKDEPSRIILVSDKVNSVQAFTQPYWKNKAEESERLEQERRTYTQPSGNSDTFNADIALQYINPSENEFDWRQITAAFKRCGGSRLEWEQWTRTGANYKQGEEKEWDKIDRLTAPGVELLINRLKQGRTQSEIDDIIYECKTGKKKVPLEQYLKEKNDYSITIGQKRSTEPHSKPINNNTSNYPTENTPAENDRTEAYSNILESSTMSNNIDSLLAAFSSADNKSIPTGFKQLDKHLGGGLHKGELTLIGAAPSLGKTTLAMQIIENIAQTTAEHVLVFSLEMSKAQHFSKSLSRLSWETNPKIRDSQQDFFLLQAGEISSGTAMKEPLERALNQYRTYADRLHIFDNDRNINFISETVEKFIEATGKKPIIVIDYVQLLKTDNNKASAMDVIQETVSALNKLKSKYNLAIIGIVAFNRASNRDGNKVNLDSGRDTSDLEYSADTYIALNFTEWETDGQEYHSREVLAKQNPRAMTAKILKQRMGEPYSKIDLIYRPHIHHFEELSGNIRNIKADELKPENVSEREQLERDIKRLELVQKQLEAGDIDRHITADHKRFTKDNAHRITELIKEKRAKLDSLEYSIKITGNDTEMQLINEEPMEMVKLERIPKKRK